MRHPRLVYGVLVAGAFALVAVLVADYAKHRRHRVESCIALGQQAGTRVADALDDELETIQTRAVAFAGVVLALESERQLLDRIRAESHALPILLGVTVAFEPGRFGGRERYAPFFNKSRDEFQFVEDTYDYTSRELATARWYTRVASSRKAQWSDPYYAAAAEAMVVDYGVPLFDARGELAGVVDYAITLSDFTRIVDSLSVGEAGYGFTYEPGGAILSHPDSQYLLENVFQLRDGKNEAILETMRHDAEGVVRYHSTYTYRLSWFFFRELASTGWKSVLVFSEDDLLGASDQGRRKAIHIVLAVGVLLTAVLLFAFPVTSGTPHRLWWIVAGGSLAIVSNIAFIWYLNVTTDFSLLDRDQERVVNHTVLGKYVSGFDEELHKLTQTRYQTVPTGIYIESYEVTSFEASLIGRLWMKYPKELVETAPPAFYFPGVSAIESRGLVREVISRVDQDEHVLVTWKFRATIEQDFSYQQFPFEQNDIRLVILYPDPSKHILLVPDLDGYDILNPSAKPGLDSGIAVPSSETISSFFTFETIDYKTSFGNRSTNNSHPALSFNMAAKRIFLNPFIANMMPILIVAIILFIVLHASSNPDDARSGLTTMTVIQSSAGFLFILLLAHVNERNRIQTPEIAYIELFYFSMYVLITLQAGALAMSLQGSGWKLLRYRDHLILRAAFWPVLLSTWLGITLVRFY